MNGWQGRWTRPYYTAVLLVLGSILLAQPARAEFSYDDLVLIIASEKWESFIENHTKEREKEIINLAWETYEEKLGDSAIGQAMIGGQRVSLLPDHSITDLTFRFVSADTGETISQVDINSVLYQKQTNPPTMEPVFEDVGIGTDAGTDFAVPFEVEGFEPLIVAIPLDAGGDPLIVVGPGGWDVAQGIAINIPIEPAVPVMGNVGFVVTALCLAVAGALVIRRQRVYNPV